MRRACPAGTESGKGHMCLLTRHTLHLQSKPKERRNSSQSGTHLRQTGGFFVPASCRYKPMRCLRREGG
ncbi:hypothetical protein XHV734_0770 [Xanthomonas hortorum pv. vitians]|nr:hypothetical protein XHV734_0770 [Xanthomonas hortorum pv. vitians]